MRCLPRLALAFLVLSPPLLADPLGNFKQIFPFGAAVICIPCAVFIWSLAYCRATSARQWRPWFATLITVAFMAFAGVMLGDWQSALFLSAFSLLALISLSPFAALYFLLWYWIASRAYRSLPRVPPLGVAVSGIFLMPGVSGAVIWTVFPEECRQIFRHAPFGSQ